MKSYRIAGFLIPLALAALTAGAWIAQECGCVSSAPEAATVPAPASFAWEAPWSRPAAQVEAPLPLPDRRWLGAYPLTRPRVYTGAHREYVMMPIGGIGTGSIWLDGDGRLAVWQIFNNYTEARIPDSFLAVRVQVEGKAPVIRMLQATPEAGFAPVKSLDYEGGYPIARLHYRDPDLPVQVTLEAYNPMIPTDAARSAMPCALFRVTARNTGEAAVQVHVLGTLQNAVGSGGAPGVNGIRYSGYGGNRNEFVAEQGLSALFMHQGLDRLAPGIVKVRDAAGALVRGPALLWVDRLGGPVETAAAGPRATALVESMARLTRDGGGIVAAGATPQFFESVASVQKKMGRRGDLEIFEDFEKGSYAGWTAKGEAFGERPHTGTTPGQNPVSGFMGKGLVNTFVPNDVPQGDLTSKPFTIAKRYIGFLIGGGGHAGQTCMNLLVDGKVARTATGKNQERLEATTWDVADLRGKQAVLEIVDRHSGGWGHVNLDHIVFADVPPDALMRLDGAVEVLATGIHLPFESVSSAVAPAGRQTAVAEAEELKGVEQPWQISGYTRLSGAGVGSGYRVLARLPGGDPLILAGPAGQATLVLCLAPGLPESWLARLLPIARGRPLAKGEQLVSGSSLFGSMALASPNRGVTARNWTEGESLAAEFARNGALEGNGDSVASPEGQTVNGALSVPLAIPAGGERTATLAITWHFPNVERHGHDGNLYSRRFPDALGVARAVSRDAAALWERTRLYHDTLYQSNLPEEWLDAISSQSVIFRGPTAWWAEDGYFAGYEGCYGCCPLNCTHVWNYAQSHARLYPELGRNMRQSDLLVYLRPGGETSHRQHAPHGAFIDGHAATIEGAYREYQLSPDRRFLQSVWPNLQQAVEWMVQRIDADEDGVPAGRQPNTYDCDVSGANTFIGSQYLSALAAGERMALAMGKPDVAGRWLRIREAGMKNQNERLWNGEYYIQIPDPAPAHDYNTGCHSDQLLGQWWAHQLGLGYLYPRERVHQALQAVMRHNFRDKFAGFQQAPRRYIPDDEGGLLMCTWPNGGRPNPFTIYADEVWTGIEYAVAGQMIYEGMIDDARRVVRMARSRYDGRRRDGLNSGPGGNPFNELECGKFYARAMSSWGLLIAAQGQVLEGPAGVLGFKPNWQPEDHRSLFTAPEGWGLFVQKREAGLQTERIEVRHGRLGLAELVLALPEGAGAPLATVKIAGKPVATVLFRDGAEVRLRLPKPLDLREGQAVDVSLAWER